MLKLGWGWIAIIGLGVIFVSWIIIGSIIAKIRALKMEHAKLNDLWLRLKKTEDEIASAKNKLEKAESALEILIKEKTVGFPWLASAYAEYKYLLDMQDATALEKKKNPARKSAEAVRAHALEKREISKQLRMANYQLQYYESLFPWLLDFREAPDDVIYISDNISEPCNEDRARQWLSESEYNKLPSAEKFQIALDRYCSRKKSNWEIGRDFERYIGYTYEQQGYKVNYMGAIKGFEDMGRDLIAIKHGETVIIQCKYWAKSKTIHEKHLFQLFGTTVEYCVHHLPLNQHLNLNDYSTRMGVKSIFVTSASLSDTANQIARILGIEVREGIQLERYPMVKCNVARKADEKIYHLPFDQQYDKVLIEPERGEFFAMTVAEAEGRGFRRAFKWQGDSHN